MIDFAPARSHEVLRALTTADHTHTLDEIDAGIHALRGYGKKRSLCHFDDVDTVVEGLTNTGHLVRYRSSGEDVWGLPSPCVVGNRVTRVGGGRSGLDGRIGTVTAVRHDPETRSVGLTLRYADGTTDLHVSPRLMRTVTDDSCTIVSYGAEVHTASGWEPCDEQWADLSRALAWARAQEGTRVRVRSTDGLAWERFGIARHAFVCAAILPPAWERFAVPVDRDTTRTQVSDTYDHLNSGLTEDLMSGYAWLIDRAAGRGWEVLHHPWEQWARHDSYGPPTLPRW